VSRTALRLAVAGMLAAGLLALAPVGQARRVAAPTLKVTFTAAGAISVTLPDGTPVGVSTGSPTVIPAGYYTLLFYGPGDCINLPLFELHGPGVDINDDMLGGETDVHTLYANFLPNSTYTWHSDRNAALVYAFQASSQVVATAPAPSSSSSGSGSQPVPTSEDIVGSAILPFRGTLAGAVTASGRLTLSYKGKSVAALKAGRYTVAVKDASSTSGFMLEKTKHAPRSVTGASFVGKDSLTLTLTKGTWLVLPRAGKATYSIAVS
jgi:hypothetical protein